MIELRGLSKRFGDQVLFDAVDLVVAAGETVAITGESGSGKSTLLNVVAGLEPADSGQVLIDGADMLALDDDARSRLRSRRIGFVFQAFHVLPYLTAQQNVELPLMLADLPRREREAAAAAMLDAVGLGARRDATARTLSGGELQRVALARALVHRPQLVLADEPTGNLDPARADGVLALLRDQARERGAALLLVTHSERAAAACDRSFALRAGQLVARA